LPTTPRGFGLGLIPDVPDDRDRLHAATPTPYQFIDLEPDPATPPIWDQGQLGSCSAHGTLAAFLFAAAKSGADDPMLSRLQLYYDTRVLEGTVDQDAGGMIRDAIKATTQGIAPEDLWPYDVSQFAVQPPDSVRAAGLANVGLDYARVGCDHGAIQGCLSQGFPVVIGVSLYSSFEDQVTLASGVVPMPGPDEQVIGGHCMAIFGVGFGREWRDYPNAEPDTLYVKVRNSWGLVYQGRTGYCLIPADYMPLYGSDFWVIRKAS